MESKKIPVGILGATGMVGQRFITLLKDHPYFEVVALAASPKSAGKKYSQAVDGRWDMKDPIPDAVKDIVVQGVESDIDDITKRVKLVFCAVDIDKETTRKIEEDYAARNIAVVSNNSAHRWTPDVPMVLPEINPEHLQLIDIQRKNRGWDKGLIVVKPNCSIQCYVPMITPLLKFKPTEVVVTTLQAISGAGKTFESWPEMVDNVNPLIRGEEEKSEKEPLKIWGEVTESGVKDFSGIQISATCIRVPVSDGHMASVSIKFGEKPSVEQILEEWSHFNPLADLDLPSAPSPFITYFEEQDRPQTALDRDLGNGMGISAGRLRRDNILDYKFIGLSHNTIRGAAGGAILTAELLKVKGYI